MISEIRLERRQQATRKGHIRPWSQVEIFCSQSYYDETASVAHYCWDGAGFIGGSSSSSSSSSSQHIRGLVVGGMYKYRKIPVSLVRCSGQQLPEGSARKLHEYCIVRVAKQQPGRQADRRTVAASSDDRGRSSQVVWAVVEDRQVFALHVYSSRLLEAKCWITIAEKVCENVRTLFISLSWE